MNSIFSKNESKSLLFIKFIPVIFMAVMFSLSGCLNSSNTGSSPGNSNSQSSSSQGPKGATGPAGPAGTPSLFLYDRNNIKIGSWLLYYDGGTIIHLWDNDNDIFGIYNRDNQTPDKFDIILGTLKFTTSNCTGTPYFYESFPRGSNLVFRANNQIYRTTNNFIDVVLQSEKYSDGSCVYQNNINNVSVKAFEAVQYPGNLPISINGPITISRY